MRPSARHNLRVFNYLCSRHRLMPEMSIQIVIKGLDNRQGGHQHLDSLSTCSVSSLFPSLANLSLFSLQAVQLKTLLFFIWVRWRQTILDWQVLSFSLTYTWGAKKQLRRAGFKPGYSCSAAAALTTWPYQAVSQPLKWSCDRFEVRHTKMQFKTKKRVAQKVTTAGQKDRSKKLLLLLSLSLLLLLQKQWK